MHSTASIESSPSFAGILSTFAAADPKGSFPWKEEDLPDDIATLSYERALRAHSRYKAPATMVPSPGASEPTPPLAESAGKERLPVCEALSADRPLEGSTHVPVTADSRANTGCVSLPEPSLKCASITVRLSREECAQLRQRAAEAGLTVSAYLRSCTFEAESLRAMVKETLAQLRSEPGQAPLAVRVRPSSRWRHWLVRIWRIGRFPEDPAQA